MYGVTKVFSERLGEYYHRKFGVDFRGVRLPAVIGPGRGGGGASAYSTLMISEPALGRPYEVFVEEDVRMPLLYIKDAVDCLIRSVRSKECKVEEKGLLHCRFFTDGQGDLDCRQKGPSQGKYSIQAE